MFSLRTILCSLALVVGTLPCEAQVQWGGKPPEFDKYGYLVRNAAWTFKPGERRVIYVCWENPTSDNEQARHWVKDQVTKTWQKHSAIKFEGWQSCFPNNKGIRIIFSDEGARVEKFGRDIDGVKSGMILNGTFAKWSTGCQAAKESCIRSIAVHEFGHALGFAHEQNRPDTPGECAAEHGQGQTDEVMLTPYDKDSVMNYCNPKYNNDGRLSALDIKALQAVYGKP